MRRFLVHIFSVALLAVGASTATAGPERIQLPVFYGTDFVFVDAVDKPDRDRPVIRFIYINREAAEKARKGEPLPLGTKIIMAEQFGGTKANGQPQRDKHGRFVATKQIHRILVSEKQDGWGETYPEEERVGDWEFAVFSADGKLMPDVDYDACRRCHRQAVTYDFTFSVFPNLSALQR